MAVEFLELGPLPRPNRLHLRPVALEGVVMEAEALAGVLGVDAAWAADDDEEADAEELDSVESRQNRAALTYELCCPATASIEMMWMKGDSWNHCDSTRAFVMNNRANNKNTASSIESFKVNQRGSAV